MHVLLDIAMAVLALAGLPAAIIPQPHAALPATYMRGPHVTEEAASLGNASYAALASVLFGRDGVFPQGHV